MQFNIELPELLRVMASVQSVVERRTTMPILANIKIETVGGGIRMTATDMEVEYSDVATADVVQQGVSTVPAALFDTAKKMNGGTVSFAIADGAASIKCGRSKFSVPVLDATDFPIMKPVDGVPSFEITGSELADLFTTTKGCISDDVARHYLNGVYLVPNGDITAVATDGHKFAMVTADGVAFNPFPGVIVPRKTVMEIIKMCDGASTVSVWVTDQKIVVTSVNARIVSKVIDATFPDYSRIIPNGKNATVSVDGKEFASSVDRVSSIYSEKTKAVKVEFGRETATVSASGGGSSAEEIIGIENEGTPMVVGFNSRYLCDITAAAGRGPMFIDLVDPNSPTVFRPVNDENKLFLVMPMRTL